MSERERERERGGERERERERERSREREGEREKREREIKGGGKFDVIFDVHIITVIILLSLMMMALPNLTKSNYQGQPHKQH